VTGNIQASLLTIEPGVDIRIVGPYGIDVLSLITAVGRQDAPITFAPKYPFIAWKGMKFQNTQAGSVLSHFILEGSDNSGMRMVDGQAPVLSDCEMRNNRSSGDGGAINATGLLGDLQIHNCTFTGNTASANGGAISATGFAGTLDVQDSTFAQNTTAFHGGAIRASGGNLRISGSVFESNAANPSLASGDYMGGALWLQGGDCSITNSRFTGNQSNAACYTSGVCTATGRGGAIYVAGTGTVAIDNSELVGNTSHGHNETSGGCSSSKTISYGGGLYVDSGGSVTLTNSLLSCNRNLTSGTGCSPSAAGSGLYVNGGTVVVVNSTIARNSNATGAHRAGGTLSILNSIVFFNNGDGTQLGGTITVNYSDVQNRTPGASELGNLNENPVFAGTGCQSDDLRIATGSAAIDAGNPETTYNDTCLPPSLGTDRNDMGAFGGPGACGWMQ
jgi:predicted outer membrane repeat protein